MSIQDQKSPIYCFEVVENNTLTVQFLAKSDKHINIAKELKAQHHPYKANIWIWYITKNQDIRNSLQKNKNFITCFKRTSQNCIDCFHNFLIFEQHQPHTIKCYMSSVNIVLDQFPEIESHGKIPSFDKILDFFKDQNWMQSYINQHINALKKFFYQILFVNKNKYRFDRPQNEIRTRNILKSNDINTLTNHQPNTRANLLIEIALATGLKTNELEHLKVSDFIGNRLTIIGTRPRTIEIPNHLTNKINNYLNSNIIENREYLFCNNRGGKLSKSTIQRWIRRTRSELLNIEKFTLKDLRHTFAINTYNDGIEFENLQNYMGYIGLYSAIEYFSLINFNQRFEMMNRNAS